MKKWISAILGVILTLTMCTPVLAASTDGKAGSETITKVPESVDISVVLSADLTPGYKGTVTDGKVTVSGPGFTAEADNAPSDAVRLVIIPITDDEVLDWFNGRVGSSWSSTGTVYVVFYEDANGKRLDADGVSVTVEVPQELENLNVYSVGTDDSSNLLDYIVFGTSVTFTTDGRLYYGVTHRKGVVEEEMVIGSGAPETTLDMTPDEIADVVLSDEEQGYLDDGIDVHIKLEVEDITDTVSASDKQAVESVANGYTTGEYIDIELLKQIGDRPWENVHETKSPIRITVEIPERLLGPANREFAVVRVHDGTASFLSDLDSDPKTVTFETSEFSTYAILYRDPEPAPDHPGNPGGNPGQDQPGNPGDNPGQDQPGNPGDNPGQDQPGNPGSEPGQDQPGNPGDNPGQDQPGNPGSEPGQDQPGNPGDNPGQDQPGNPGSEPGQDQPGNPGTAPGTGKPDFDVPQTGDDTNLALWFMLMAFSLFGIAVALIQMKSVAHMNAKKSDSQKGEQGQPNQTSKDD